MCKNMIYDILINPLPLNHLLHGKINFEALKRCGISVTNSIYRAIKDFPISPSFFIEEVEQVEPSFSLRIRIPTEKTPDTDFEKDEKVWNKFFKLYPHTFEEFQNIIDQCVDTGVAKKTIHKEQLIKQFLMDILRKVLSMIPSVHSEHTNIIRYVNPPSIGSVCNWKIVAVRRLAGLPVDKYVPKNVYYF